MDIKCRAVREVLGRATKEKAVSYICSFTLPQMEETVLIAEVCGKSVQQVAMEQHVSPETVKRWRKRALLRISAELNI